MEFVGFLILFPFLVAAVIACTRNDGIRKAVVYVSSTVIIAVAIWYSVMRLLSGGFVTYLPETEVVDIIMMCGEVFLMALIVVLSVKHKKTLPAILSVAQTGLILWLEIFADKPEKTEEMMHLYCDKLTIVMCLIVAVVGCLI